MARRLVVFGLVLLASMVLCAHTLADRGGPAFLACWTVAAISYLLAVREAFSTPHCSRLVLVWILAIAALAHVAFLRAPTGWDDDVRRYLWDGRLQHLGLNPYLVIPSAPSSRLLHTPETQHLNSSDLPSPYPAGAQLFFRAVSAVQQSTIAFRVAFVVCEAIIAGLLLCVLHRSGQGAHRVLAFAWSPLLAVEVPGSGHIDILMATVLLISAVALHLGWRRTAAICLGLAIAVKFLPIVLAPLYWKRVRLSDAAMAAMIVALLYVPFLHGGHVPAGSLGAYLQGFRFNGPLFALWNHFLPASVLAAFALAAGLLTSWLMRAKLSTGWAPEAFAWPLAVSLLCAPVVFPWYLLSLLPFLTSRATAVLMVWSVSLAPTYILWHWRTLGRPWGALPWWSMAIEYSMVIAAGLIGLRRSRASHTALMGTG